MKPLLTILLILFSCTEEPQREKLVRDTTTVSVPLPDDPDSGGGPQDPDSWTPPEPTPIPSPPGDPSINDPDNPNDNGQ